MTDVSSLALGRCSVCMLAQVEIKVGDDLQFHPQLEGLGSGWEKFCNTRLGKLARIIAMRYDRDPALDKIAFAPASMYANPSRLMLKVRFQEEFELYDVAACHFMNHAPRPSPF